MKLWYVLYVLLCSCGTLSASAVEELTPARPDATFQACKSTPAVSSEEKISTYSSGMFFKINSNHFFLKKIARTNKQELYPQQYLQQYPLPLGINSVTIGVICRSGKMSLQNNTNKNSSLRRARRAACLLLLPVIGTN